MNTTQVQNNHRRNLYDSVSDHAEGSVRLMFDFDISEASLNNEIWGWLLNFLLHARVELPKMIQMMFSLKMDKVLLCFMMQSNIRE